ncbi:PREDICTED: CD177 antigen [Galeopterus variegatus]|uniref:CD177 antigen n=1 Tax=Galeopterus variegatus TaxID=482537 RepID=A0ABM0QLD9_GALVR|nr:PREDICTED: CD177 antigen [Galeopterus variegatus]
MGLLFSLPGQQALVCQWGTLQFVRNVSDMPLQWTAGQQSCEIGWGCQDTLMFIENGPQVNLVLSKSCTQAEDQEAQVTHHRAGPGLSVVSYTHVCRQKDFCNDLSTTAPLWAPPLPTEPGPVRCPVCFPTFGCPEDAAEQICPAGYTHCYNGVLQLRGANISTNLKVQGCMSQPGCNLLNGTRKIGPIDVSESCNAKDFLFCHRGVTLQIKANLTQEPAEWTTSSYQMCGAGEVCQETLLLIDVGYRSLLLGSKGCSKAGVPDSQTVSIHSGPLGVLVASYVRYCSSDYCNRASTSSVLLNALPHPAAPAPGDLRCPVCVQLSGSCLPNSNYATCPNGTTHCYNGHINLRGGGVTSTLSVQGCMAPSSISLLNHTRNIGAFSVKENFEGVPEGTPKRPFLRSALQDTVEEANETMQSKDAAWTKEGTLHVKSGEAELTRSG